MSIQATILGILGLFSLSTVIAHIFGKAAQLGSSYDSSQHPDKAAWEADHRAIKSDWQSVIHWDDEDWDDNEYNLS